MLAVSIVCSVAIAVNYKLNAIYMLSVSAVKSAGAPARRLLFFADERRDGSCSTIKQATISRLHYATALASIAACDRVTACILQHVHSIQLKSMWYSYVTQCKLFYLRDLKVRLHIAVSVVHAAQVVVRASDNALSIATHSALKLVKDAVILVQVTQLFGAS
eukprot:17487-Heterococcus_DN1.PRE.2